MSYIHFDYKCPGCGAVESRFVRREAMDIQYHYECKDTETGMHPMMRRLPAGTRTTFRFADTKLKE